MRIFPDWIDGYLEYTNNSEPSELFRLWTAIATVGAALERRVWLNWESKTYANMYIVLVGPAGKARKGTAMRPAKTFLNELGINLAAESMTREALITRLAGTGTAIPHADLVSGQTFQPHASLTIWSEEWTVFIGYNNQILMADLCTLYDCPDKWQYETKRSGTFPMENVWLHMFAATTPKLIQSTLPQDSVGGGLTSRTVFVYAPDKDKMVMFPIKTQKEMKLEEQLTSDLKQIHSLNGAFKFTEAIAKRYAAWRIVHEKNPPFADTILDGYDARRQTHLMKLAMILCASRSNDMILQEVDMERAIKILDLTERNMLMTFRGVGRSDYAATMHRLMEVIERRRKITRKELVRLFWQDLTDVELQAMLTSLSQMGFIRVDSDASNTYIHYIEEEKPNDTSTTT